MKTLRLPLTLTLTLTLTVWWFQVPYGPVLALPRGALH